MKFRLIEKVNIDDVPEENKHGDCYVQAYRYMQSHPDVTLVHGIVTGQGPIQGLQYNHAWIEDGDMVIDKTINLTIPKIMNFCEFLGKNEINILNPKDSDKDFLNILNKLNNTKGSLELIISLSEEDCRYLQEIAFDMDNCFITAADIQEMSKCSNFIRE